MVHQSRPAGWGVSPIPLSELQAYADLVGFDQEERLLLVRYVRAMDAAYLTWVEQRRDAKKDTAN